MSDSTVPISSDLLDNPQRRAGGWLLFFICTLVFIGPAVRISNFLGSYRHNMELISWSSHPNLRLVFYASEQLAAFAVRGYGLFAGIQLWKISSGAVGQAKRFLFYLVLFSVADYATGAMFALLMTPDAVSASAFSKFLAGQTARALLQTCGYAAIWYSYLVKSDRVRMTFLRDRNSSEIARDRTREQSNGMPYRWILPIAQLLICAAVLWPIRSEIDFETRSSLHGDSATATLKRERPDASPNTLHANLVDWTPTMLNLPVMFVQVPYAILNPTKTEWVPNGMNPKIWRAISWPFFGLIFWWIAGRGVDALIAARRCTIDPSIGWAETGVGVLLLAGGILIFIASFARASDNDGSGIFMSGSGALWAMLGAAIIIARIAQWRIRVRLRSAPAPEALPS